MRQFLIVLAFAAASVGASPSNSYFDVSAFALAYDESSSAVADEAIGLRYRHSIAVDDEWFWPFEVALFEYELERGILWKTGVGYAFPLDSMDVLVKAEIGGIDYGTGSGSGYSWDVQMRSVQWDRFELNGHFGQANSDPVDSFIRYGIGMAWKPFETMSFVIEYDQYAGDVVDLEAAAIGLRWEF